ncbi:MAG: molybdenum cofactor biosynthesis protein MoaE [Saprospiraceae bacterium]|nr:molybdenum cofactor biosynthesis protein MoaE [Saprospiraceae bacterium]
MKAKAIKNIFVQGSISPELIADSIRKHAHNTGIGGHSIFLGQVRADEKPEGTVSAIDYTAYEDMALEQAHQIREEIFAKYPLTCMHIYHSIGLVPAGELSLFVFTSSVHRKVAIDACEELVERLKGELPVWGREIMGPNQYTWKENR